MWFGCVVVEASDFVVSAAGWDPHMGSSSIREGHCIAAGNGGMVGANK